MEITVERLTNLVEAEEELDRVRSHLQAYSDELAADDEVEIAVELREIAGLSYERQPVRLWLSPLTKRVYALTSYHERADGMLVADIQHDVTADFEALAGARR